MSTSEKPAEQTTDPLEARLQQLDRAIADAKRYYLKLMAERYDLMMIKYAPINPHTVVKVCDAI